jgi:CHAT domain-containing protein/Tfp pilus assembly protein PilF
MRGIKLITSETVAAVASNLVVVLLVGLLLTISRATSAQSPAEATALNEQVVRLYNQGRYSEATSLAQRVLQIRETLLGQNHPDVATSLNNLASLYQAQGLYTDAEPLYKRALGINEKTFGTNHPSVAATLNNLAQLYQSEGRYADAEPLLKRSLAINERAKGANNADVALSLNNLARLYQEQSRYADAEPLFKRSLTIKEHSLGSNHPSVAVTLNNLASLYQAQGRYTDAEPLYKRALAINEQSFGRDHLEVAASLNNLASLYQAQGRYLDAEPLYTRSQAIWEKILGKDHPNLSISLGNLAELYRLEGRYTDAEPLYKRAIETIEKASRPDHLALATSLNNLATLYTDQGRYSDAEPLYKRALGIRERSLGPRHVSVAVSLNNLADVYRVQGKYADAEPLYKRSLEIWEGNFGPDHPDVSLVLNNLAELYRAQNLDDNAEPLFKRALAVLEKALGASHPNLASTLNNLGALYKSQGRYGDAEPLYKRSLEIAENRLGPNHPDVANSLNNLAALYESQRRYADAEILYKKSLAIVETSFGSDHPDVAGLLNNLAVLYQAQGRNDDAEQLLKRSLTISERFFDPSNRVVAKSLNNLAELYRTEARFAEALPIVKRTISLNVASKPVALAVLFQAETAGLAAPNEVLEISYDLEQRLTSSTAGKAVSMTARFAAGSNELAQLVRKDQDIAAEAEQLNKNILSAVSKPPGERNAAAEAQMRKRIGEIKLERDKLEDVFKRRFPEYVALSNPQALSISETQALLADDEALIAFDIDARSHVWVITKDRAAWKELSISAAEIAELVTGLRAALDPEGFKPFDLNLAYRLHEAVLGPIEEPISEKARLSFVLSGALTSLPPQVLITRDPAGKGLASADWLIRKDAITVLPSAASLKVLRAKSAAVAGLKPMIGFGDPVFHRTASSAPSRKVANFNKTLASFYRGAIADTKSLAEALPSLPETADELRAVAKELGAKAEDIRLGEAATVLNVKRAPLDNFRVVYFATHALVAGEVERFAKVRAEPSLVLSIPVKPTEDDDGLLRASDVAMLKMNADFVVLSACSTAAGEKANAEALSGLARAFFYAGARSLLVSNWEVESESTVALMAGLFDAQKRNPDFSYAEALRSSMLQMIDNPARPEWSQPKFWAPFIVVGEPKKN